MDDVLKLCKELHDQNAWHVRRGFRMKEVSVASRSNHLLEEVVELQAEIMQIAGHAELDTLCLEGEGREAVLEELGDVAATLCDLILRLGLNLQNVEQYAVAKVKARFTHDASKVTAITNGATRRGRLGE